MYWNFSDFWNCLLKWQTSYLRMRAQFKRDWKILCFSPLTTVQYFFEIRPHGFHRNGRDSASLYSQWCQAALTFSMLACLYSILCFPAYPDTAVSLAAGPRSSSALPYRGGPGPASNPAAGWEWSAGHQPTVPVYCWDDGFTVRPLQRWGHQ